MALTDGMTEFWTLNDTLAGYNGNTLVSPDGLTHYVAGAIDKGWDVADVINQVLRQTPGPFNPGATDFSISMWVYVTDETAPTNGYLLTVRDGTTIRFRFGFADAVSMAIYINTAGASLDYDIESPLVAGWNHVLLTFVPSGTLTTVTLWLNGQKTASSNPTQQIPTMATPNLYVGGSGAATGTTAAYDEKIDAVGLWSRVLTDLEIAALYNAGAGWEPSAPTPTTYATLQINDGPLAGQYIVLRTG